MCSNSAIPGKCVPAFCAVLALSTAFLSAGKVASKELVPIGQQWCVFADRAACVRFGGIDEKVLPLRVEWAITSNGRTISRGNSTVRELIECGSDDASMANVHLQDKQICRTFDLQITAPRLREGISFSFQLQVSAVVGGELRKFSHTLHVFSEDPFSGRESLLNQAELQLFDNLGDTKRLFQRAKIPHRVLLNLAAIDRAEAGILVVGEGISFVENPHLAATLMQAANRGVRVLCFAPSDGEFPINSHNLSHKATPSQITLGHESLSKRAQQQFDPLVSNSGLEIKAQNNSAVLQVTKPNGWNWAILEYAAPEPHEQPGRLIICCGEVIGQWEESPVPRYLFAQLVEDMRVHSSTKDQPNDYLK